MLTLIHSPRRLDALSFVKYAYVAISLNELNGLDLHCDPKELKNGESWPDVAHSLAHWPFM